MRVDLGNVLDTVAGPGISRDGLDRLDEQVRAAHERITAGIEARDHGYAALALPETTDPSSIREAVAPFEDAAAVLTVGIGGSALGAATVAAALESEVAAPVLDNVDPAYTRSLLADLPLEETVVNVVSRSGTTTETLANFLVVREAMADAGVDWTERTIVTTGPEGPLRSLAERRGLTTLSVPAGVPGRYAVLSPVGLVVAAIRGHDIEALLAGARAAAAERSPSLFESPGYAYGAVTEALARRGVAVNAMMPYDERLETFAEWFAQLWAESLGKDGLGQTPVRALGVTDQHSQLQLYRAGPRNTLVTFVRVDDGPDVPVPDPMDDAPGFLADESLGSIREAELTATEASLAAAGRPNVRIEVDRLDEAGLGDLLYELETSCVLAGELAGVDPFNQPAVEWAKRATRGMLGDDDYPEARTAAEKTTFVIE